VSSAIPAAVTEAFRAARHVLVLTGSGASAESGVPTFRDAQSGLWERFDPHELATPEAFLHDPALVWRWYRWRRELVSRTKPNAGHFALATLEERLPRLTLVTQNVDGLHQRAGSTDVIEFHGNLFATRCFSNSCAFGTKDEDADVPRCSICGGLLRPGVVWFGEAIPAAALATSESAAADCDLFLSIGTSSTVWPAAGLARSAAGHGALVVEINPDETAQSGLSDYTLRRKSGELLPELVDSLAV
jgi:NAD-dependent deacetylase